MPPLKIPVVPGVTTLVTPDSKSNLPTGQDREKEVVLPPGSATPRAPGTNDKNIPGYEMNKPDNDIPDRPRTLPESGETHGNPTKFDYNYVTRRTAYKREWTPGKRQQRQRGVSRVKSRQRYMRNRSKEKIRAKLHYRRNKNNPQFKSVQKHRRKFPAQHRRRRAYENVSLILRVAALYLEGWEAGKPMPSGVERQHNQYGQDKIRSKKVYRKDMSKRKTKARMRYHQFCKRNPRCKMKKLLYNKYPKKFERHKGPRKPPKNASILTTPQIQFVLGEKLIPGTVHSVSPMLGTVTFVLSKKDWGPIHSMPVIAFLRSVIFLSEEDIDAFFELVDAEIGPEAYDELDIDTLNECTQMFDRDPDFVDRCLSQVDTEDFESMSSSQISVLLESLVWNIHRGEATDRQKLIEGEVRLAELLYDQESPNAGDKEYPGSNVGYAPSSSKDWVHSPDEKEGVPKGETIDHKTDNAPPASSRVTPGGEGQMWSGEATYLKAAAATINQIESNTAPAVAGRAQGLKAKLKRADPTRGIWSFTVPGSKGENYTVTLKGVPKGNTKDLSKLPVRVSCTCNFFRYQGPEHWAQAHGYLYGKPRGTAEEPTQKDPQGKHWACKHVLAVFKLAKGYKVASLEFIPSWLPLVLQVARRYSGQSGV